VGEFSVFISNNLQTQEQACRARDGEINNKGGINFGFANFEVKDEKVNITNS